MSHRKRINREEPMPEVMAQKREHPKHSENFSKKRNERFSIRGLQTRITSKPKRAC
jgi:hypothetical protein